MTGKGRRQETEEDTLPSHYNQPTPRASWASPSGPQLVHPLWHCAPVAHPHMCTYTSAPTQCTHTHTCTHTRTHTLMPGVFPESTQETELCPILSSSSVPRGLPGPQVPRPSPGLAHAGIPRLLKRGDRAGRSPETGCTECRICSYKALVQHRLNVLII